MYNIFNFKVLFRTTVEQNIAINDHNDAVILSIGHYRYKTKHIFLK